MLVLTSVFVNKLFRFSPVFCVKNPPCGKNVKVECKYAQRCSVKWEFRDHAKLERFLGTDVFMGPLWPFTAPKSSPLVLSYFVSCPPSLFFLAQSRNWCPDTKMTLKTKAYLKMAFLADSCRQAGFGVVVWICVVCLRVLQMTHWAVETSCFLGGGNECVYICLSCNSRENPDVFHVSPFSWITSAKIYISAESIHPSHFFHLYPFTSSKSA